jgi:hypothetical protein
MKIEPQEYLQKLVEVYQTQCSQYLQERVSLQAQLDLVLIEIEKLEARIKELEPEENEVVDVNSNTNT